MSELNTPNALETIKNRSNFYVDQYRKVTIALLVMVALNAALVAFAYIQITNKPQPEYFATTSSGRIVKLQPLSQPIVTPSVILEWSTRAAVAAYTYNFVDYRKQLEDASHFFTPNGWRNFEEELKRSRNLQTVIASKLVATAVPTGAPVIEDRMVLFGRYTWKVSIPLLVKYDSASTSYNQPLVVKMIIQRVPELNNEKGIAISQFVASPSEQRN